MPYVIVLGILAASYFIGKKLKPKVESIDAQEATAPAPYSDQPDPDYISPDDLNNGFYVLDEQAQTESGQLGLWQFPQNPDPGSHYHRPQPHPTEGPKMSNGPAMFKLGTCNIKNFPDMPPRFVHADAKTAGEHCTIWGGQEIQAGEDTPVVMAGLADTGAPWDLVHGNFESPIFYRSDLYEASDLQGIHYDRSALNRPESHQGAAVGAKFQSIHHPDIEFAVVNTHLVVGAFIGAVGKATVEEWKKEWDIYRQVIQHYHSYGLTVYFTGDLNRRIPPVPLRGSHWLTASSKIDHIGEWRHNGGVVFKNQGNPAGTRINIHSDHDLLFVQGTLRKGK